MKKDKQDTSHEMPGVLELSDKSLEAATIKILQGTITNVLEINEKIKSLSEQIEDIKKNQMKF